MAALRKSMRTCSSPYFISLIFFISVIGLVGHAKAQIHRAISQSSYQIKYDTNYTQQLEHKNQQLNALKQSAKDRDAFFTTGLFSYVRIELVASILGSIVVGLSGIFPVAILPRLADDHQSLLKSTVFSCLTAFAAGSLLGDVFIHLLPETYSQIVLESDKLMMCNGGWILFGFLVFFLIEKIFPDDDDDDTDEDECHKENEKDSMAPNKSGKTRKRLENDSKTKQKNHKLEHHMTQSIRVMGILNLMANIIDNFTHGIAVAGSFQASLKFGAMTLIATMLHEIPHEIGDFVILLKSGLNYKQAAIAQLSTAFAGVVGSLFALAYSSAEQAGNATSWVLPFTSGGFLYISLVGIIPDLLKETNLKASIKQMTSLFFGVFVIYVFSLVLD